ncbi:MAG: hypothetical protein ACYCY6_03095 [Minisyncoccota bacterium]
MTPTTTSQFNTDFVREIFPWMIEEFGIATAKVFRIFWDIGVIYFVEHWGAILVGLVLIFIIALVQTIITGRWAMLGSITYNYLYFGTLFIIGLIFDPELFANDYFKIVLAILYVACFIITGHFLRKIGVRRF